MLGRGENTSGVDQSDQESRNYIQSREIYVITGAEKLSQEKIN